MAINEPERLTEVLPLTRCTPSMKERLERIAAKSVARNLTDHVRYAVEVYVEAEERKAAVHRNGDAEPVLAGRIEEEQ